MSDPTIPIVLKKLLSLDTPIARRIFEIALMLALVVGAAYVGEHVKDKQGFIEFACDTVGVLGGMVVLLQIFVLVVTILNDAKKNIPPK